MGETQEFERIIALQQKLQSQRDIAKRDLEQIEHQLQAVITTLELLRKEGVQKPAVLASEEEILAELKTKKTQVPALIAIARHNGGILLTKDAKRLLQRAGLMKATKNASNILYNVINRSERFEHIGPGEYRLKAATSLQAIAKANRQTTLATGMYSSKPPLQ